MAQRVWYLKKEDNLVWFKDKFFRPADYINLNEFVETAITESATIQELQVSPLNYNEFTYTGDNITKKEIYEDSTLTTLLYTINYAYTGDNLTQIEIIRESDSYTYYKDLAYDINDNLINIDIHV
jgi:hypothetical protein